MRDTHHANGRQCCRIGTCGSCFGTCSVARSTNVAHGSLLVAILYSTQATYSPVRLPTITHVPKCYENDSRDYRMRQRRAYNEIYSPCKLTAVLWYRNLQKLFCYLLARSPMFHMKVFWSHTYIQNNQHTPLYTFRLPPMFRSVVKATRVTTEGGSGEPTVRDTHHANGRQCCRIGTCGSCFGTFSVARSTNVAHDSLLVAILYSTQAT